MGSGKGSCFRLLLRISCACVFALSNVEYPWISDVLIQSADGPLVSAVFDGAMSLTLAGNETICLEGPSNMTGLVVTSSTSVSVRLSHSAPCVRDDFRTTAVRFCCTVPSLQALCGNDTECLSSGTRLSH